MAPYPSLLVISVILSVSVLAQKCSEKHFKGIQSSKVGRAKKFILPKEFFDFTDLLISLMP